VFFRNSTWPPCHYQRRCRLRHNLGVVSAFYLPHQRHFPCCIAGSFELFGDTVLGVPPLSSISIRLALFSRLPGSGPISASVSFFLLFRFCRPPAQRRVGPVPQHPHCAFTSSSPLSPFFPSSCAALAAAARRPTSGAWSFPLTALISFLHHPWSRQPSRVSSFRLHLPPSHRLLFCPCSNPLPQVGLQDASQFRRRWFHCELRRLQPHAITRRIFTQFFSGPASGEAQYTVYLCFFSL